MVVAMPELPSLPAFLDEPDPERSWRAFLEAYSDVVYRAVGRAVRDEDEARDVAAEVLARLRSDWPDRVRRYRTEAPGRRSRFRTWLAVVVRHLAIDVLRASRGRRELPRAVQRRSVWEQELYRRVFWEGWSLSAAAEDLLARDGEPSEREQVLEAARALHEELPAASRIVRSRVVGEATDAELAAEDEAPRDESHGALREILGELEREDRLLLRVYYLEGVTAAEAARVVGLAGASVAYRRVANLVRRLRAAVEERGLVSADLDLFLDFDWTPHLLPEYENEP